MPEEILNQISAKCSVIIIGAGQAGLSIAHSLQKKGIKPLILEKNYVGFSWKEQRWDSFCLVTPNSNAHFQIINILVQTLMGLWIKKI